MCHITAEFQMELPKEIYLISVHDEGT